MDAIGIALCTSCIEHTAVLPALGVIYFTILLFAIWMDMKYLYSASRFGIIFALLLALFFQLQLQSLCFACYLAHLAHVAGWSALNFFYERGVFLPALACIFATLVPLVKLQPASTRYTSTITNQKGAVILVLSSGCPYCETLLTNLPHLGKELDKRGFDLIVYGKGEYNGQEKKTKPLVLYQFHSSVFSKELMLQGYPAFIYVNGQGVVQKIVYGYLDPVKQDVVDTLKTLGLVSE